jgi:hypothetical protein
MKRNDKRLRKMAGTMSILDFIESRGKTPPPFSEMMEYMRTDIFLASLEKYYDEFSFSTENLYAIEPFSTENLYAIEPFTSEESEEIIRKLI